MNEKLWGKIRGPRMIKRIYYPKPNKKIYKHIRKFNSLGTCPSRLSHKIHSFLKMKATRQQWGKDTKKDITEIWSPSLQDKKEIKRIIEILEFKEEVREPTRRTWSEQQKHAHSLKMKDYWTRRKASKRWFIVVLSDPSAKKKEEDDLRISEHKDFVSLPLPILAG